MSIQCSAMASDRRRSTGRRSSARSCGRAGRRRDGPGLVKVESGGDVALPLGGRVDQGGHVAGNAAALHRDGQRPRQRAVVAQDAGGGVAGVQEGCVEPVEVLRLQAVDAVHSDARDAMPSDVGCVAHQGALADSAGSDVGEPVLEPLGDGGDGADRARSCARVPARTFSTATVRLLPVTCRRSSVPLSLNPIVT
jgi:hypothetical protein